MKKKAFSILATLLFVAQSIWAQCTALNVGALYEAVRTSQTVILGNDFTLDNGRLDIDGTTVTLDLNGHTLTRPMAAADDGGQVIAVMNGGKLTITDSGTGGKITGGWAYQGGGIYVYAGCELTITGGAITGNRADTKNGYYGYGGGVEVQSGGTLTMTGGTITGNTAGGAGNGVYQNQNVTFNIQGNPVVDDLYLTEYSFITLTGALSTGATIGLNAQKVDQTHLTLHYPDHHAGTDPKTFFSSKNDAYDICLRPDGEVIYVIPYIERAWDSDAKRGILTITGGSIYAKGNRRAIGGANFEECLTQVSLPDYAMVTAGTSAEDAVLFSAGVRVPACLNMAYAAIEPCTHSGATFTIGAFRAYFQLADGLTAGDTAGGVRQFVLNFGDEANGIADAVADSPLTVKGDLQSPLHHSPLQGWYTLDGRRLSGRPAQKGVFINNGVKIIDK